MGVARPTWEEKDFQSPTKPNEDITSTTVQETVNKISILSYVNWTNIAYVISYSLVALAVWFIRPYFDQPTYNNVKAEFIKANRFPEYLKMVEVRKTCPDSVGTPIACLRAWDYNANDSLLSPNNKKF